MRSVLVSTALFLLPAFPPAAVASPLSGGMQPQLGSFDPALIEVVRAEAEAARANGTDLHFEDTEQMARHEAEYEERRASSGFARGGTLDDDSAHYSRGTTLIMHVFIDHGGGTWSQSERDLAAAKAYVAKEFHLTTAENADLANSRFDNEGTTAYWYIQPTVPYVMEDSSLVGAVMEEALMFAGYSDADGDGSRLDDYTLGLQFWNGGWDNVIANFQPADIIGRAWASGSYAVTALYTNSNSNVWLHEWGHSFGACDEYIENGTCNSGVDCGPCQGTYLAAPFNNGNCDLCLTQNCVMDFAGADNTCWWTDHMWARADDDANGQLDWVKRRVPPSTFVDIFEVWNNGVINHFTTTAGMTTHVQSPSWAVFGLRSPPSTDYDLTLFLDNNHNFQVARSANANPGVDFIVGDYNLNRLGNEHFQVDKFSGNSALYSFSWYNTGEELYPDGFARSQTWASGNIVRAFDLPLFGGETIAVTLDVTSGSGDYGMALYRSSGSYYFANSSAAMWTSDSNGAAGTETHTFDVPADDVYGLIVWSNQDTSGSFTIQVGPASLTLADESPIQSAADLRLYQYLVSDLYWSVVGSRPASAQNVTTRLFDDVEYKTHLGTSNDYSGVEFVASDNVTTGWDHVRVIEESGSGLHVTEWEGGADLSTGYVSDSWSDNHVAKVWDVQLENGQTYFFRQYHPFFPFPRLDTGLYLMDRNGTDKVREKNTAVASSDTRPSLDGGEWFQYTATRTGFHGLVLTMNNEATDSYSVWHGPRLYPTPGDSITVSDEVAFASTFGLSNQWVVWGVRPGTGDTADIVLYQSDSFAGSVGSSDFVSGTNFMAVDYHHTTSGTVYQRYRRTSGTAPMDIAYDAGPEDLPFTPGAPQSVVYPWATREVVQAFDVWVDGSGAPQDFQILVEDLSGTMDLGVALLQSNGTAYFGGKDDAVALADAAGGGGSELLEHTVTTADWFGVVVFNNSDSSGNYRLTLGDGQAVSSPTVATLPTEVSLAPRNTPFRASTALAISLPTAGPVRLSVYDVQGRRVRTLADRVFAAGSHTIAWDGRDGSGGSVGSGVYLVRLEANGTGRTAKLVRLP